MGCGASLQNTEITREAAALAPYVKKGDSEAVRAGLASLRHTSSASSSLTHEQEVNQIVTVLIPEENSRSSSNNANTLIHLAVRSNSLKCLQELCVYNPNINVRNSMENTALHAACIVGASPEVVQFLIERKADVECIDTKGNRPMHLAARNLHGWIVRALLRSGAEKDARNEEGETPLEAANSNNANLQRRSTYRLKHAAAECGTTSSTSTSASGDGTALDALRKQEGTIDVVRDLLE